MQIVQASQLPKTAKAYGGRSGTYERRVVLAGDPDSPGNFAFIIFYQDGSFYSPRHHHNFDQFRFQIEGEADFASNGKMTPGVLGYFPEGVYYGPTSGPPHTVAVLQFGGPSGSGYMGPKSKGAVPAMELDGVFEKGIYRRNPGVAGQPNQDSYEAIWEYVNGRPLVYPQPQYPEPIMTDTTTGPWAPLEGAAGVCIREVGPFTNCEIRAARYRLDPGAALKALGRGVYFVLEGEGTVAGNDYEQLTTVYLDENEHTRFQAAKATDVLLMGMPSVALMARPEDVARMRQAAK